MDKKANASLASTAHLSSDPSTSSPTDAPLTPVKRGRGRPKKSEIEARKTKNKGVLGRPPGDAARINEFKARLLATAGDRIIDKIIHVALNDEHPGQMAALKMCADRVLPMSYFEKDKVSGGKSSVSITITGVNGDTTSIIGGDASDNEGNVYNHEE
jgi:hypothetical protein